MVWVWACWTRWFVLGVVLVVVLLEVKRTKKTVSPDDATSLPPV